MYPILFEIVKNPLGLPIHDLWEYAIVAVLAILAFGVGWQVSSGGILGFVMHWVARLLTFFVLWASTYALLAAVQWVFAHLVLVCVTVLMAVVVMVIASVTGLHRENKYYREVTA